MEISKLLTVVVLDDQKNYGSFFLYPLVFKKYLKMCLYYFYDMKGKKS